MGNRTPAEIFAPGDFINEELDARGWSQLELAEVLARPPKLVSELIAAKRAITPETARGLGAAFGTGPEFWMNLERDYRLSKTVHDDDSVERRSKLYGKTPVKEMMKRGWVEPSQNINVLQKRVLDFLQVSDIDDEPWIGHAAKKGSYDRVSPAQWAWLFRVRQLAREFSVPQYSKSALEDALPMLEALLIEPEEARHVPRILSACGLRFVIVEKLPHADIDGVCCWLNKHSPVIGMSIRRDKIDNFWFVLRHEIEHVLKGHGKETAVIDASLEGERAGTGLSLPEEERVANAAAADFCVPTKKLDSFLARTRPFFYERDVVAFARLLNRHPGLVVGQMQFRLNNYSYLTKHLVRIRQFVLTGAIVDGWDQVPSIG